MKILNALLVLSLALNPLAHAKLGECEDAVTPDRRLEALEDNEDLTEREITVLKTQLLSETLSPYLRHLHDQFVSQTPAMIRALSSDFKVRSSAFERTLYPELSELGLNKMFNEHLAYSSHQWQPFNLVRHSKYSKASIEKLMQAIWVVGKHESIINLDPFPSIVAGQNVLYQCSFTKDDISRLMNIGALSLAQAMAHLMSDEVPGLSEDQLMKAVTQPRGRMPSLVVLYSLMLAPAMLGSRGSLAYVQNPLVKTPTGLEFSPAMKDFLKAQRNHFLKKLESRPRARYEHGHGCPVAHNFTGDQQPGLQYYIDTVMHAYEALK